MSKDAKQVDRQLMVSLDVDLTDCYRSLAALKDQLVEPEAQAKVEAARQILWMVKVWLDEGTIGDAVRLQNHMASKR